VHNQPLPDLGYVAREVISFLKGRTHTEKPHISVLGPDRRTARVAFGKKTQPLITEEEEAEAFYEEIDPYRRIVPYVFGYYADFKPSNDERVVETTFTFCIRTAPPNVNSKPVPLDQQFRDVKLRVRLMNEKNAELLINIRGFSTNVSLRIQEMLKPVSNNVQEIWFEIPYASYSKRYKGIPHKVVSDPSIIRSLATLDKTDSGYYYFFNGSRGARSLDRRLIYAFAIRISVKKLNPELVRVSVLLYNCGGCVVDSKWRKVGSYEVARYMLPGDPGNYRIDRWSTEYLLEIEGRIKWSGYQKMWTWKQSFDSYVVPGLKGFLPKNCLAVENEEAREVILRDWHIAKETVPKIKCDNVRSAPEIIKEISSKYGYQKAGEYVAKAFKDVFQSVSNLYTFQTKALTSILKPSEQEGGKCLVITARTAGGKTLAFLLPILIKVVHEKLTGSSFGGVKALFFYPTKALANDQAETILKLIWSLNKLLVKDGYKPVSVGILHGDTRTRKELARLIQRQGKRMEDLRIKCPVCGNRLRVTFEEPSVNAGWALEKVFCENCGADPDLLNRSLLVVRERIYSTPPDILITNPDTINVTLMYSPKAQSVFGRNVAFCPNCGETYSNINKRKCGVCGSSLSRLDKLSYPKVIVIDEAHLLRGVFGSQVSFVLLRLEQAIRAINHLSHSWRPHYVLSSATLNNPKKRAEELIGDHNMSFDTIEAEYEESGEEEELPVKWHVFIMPKAYAPQATLARVMEKSAELWLKWEQLPPSTLIFVNRIAEANSLVYLLRDMLSGVRNLIDGHTTDYGRQRADVEDRFSTGELRILVATRGLEVGVDFDIIKVGGIYGMPYYVSDYVQRIGRIGRKADSIVFNIFMPDKPIDHFLFRNWKLLCNLRLRDHQMQQETYTIRRDNQEVVKRSAVRALFDFLSTRPDSHLFYEGEVSNALTSQTRKRNAIALLSHIFDQKALDSFMNALDGQQPPPPASSITLSKELETYLQKALIPVPPVNVMRNAILQVIENIIQDVFSQQPGGASLTQLIYRKYREAFFLWHIRHAERVCVYQFPDLQQLGFSDEERERERGLVYAFRHAVPGQIISYRGNYFSIKLVKRSPSAEPSEDPANLVWR